MGGKGVRCPGQAVVRAGLVKGPTVVVNTDAGERTVTLKSTGDRRTDLATVDMGVAKVGDDESEWLHYRLVRAPPVDIGKPHLLLLSPPPHARTDLARRGPPINPTVPQ